MKRFWDQKCSTNVNLQARELGDFIPVHSEAAPGSRLIRDDGSGDDEEEGRIHVRGLDLPSDKPKRKSMLYNR